MVENPILRGFHPDPSICRVGDDYYIATSTFEWYPGVRIHHSRDLADWRLAARPLNRPGLLDLEGVPDSCGVWAPCLTWHEGLFYLCYTVVRRFDGNFKDTHNYLTTCVTIDGEWSEPVYLNSSGFDPSLYHAPDGRKWLLNMVWDHGPDRTFFRGIILQEYAPSHGRLVGERSLIFEGTEHDCTEGPHLYRVGDHHYLMTAEGGTGYDHGVTMARSRDLRGPYEVDPAGPDGPRHARTSAAAGRARRPGGFAGWPVLPRAPVQPSSAGHAPKPARPGNGHSARRVHRGRLVPAGLRWAAARGGGRSCGRDRRRRQRRWAGACLCTPIG